MNYDDQIFFFLGAIGAFNSLLVSFYLFFNKTYSKLQNRLFALFLLTLTLRVLKSLFYSFSTEEPIWFLQSGPSFFLLIGPLFFNYIVSVIKPDSYWVKIWKFHTFFWGFVVILLMIIFPFRDFIDLNKNFILPLINTQWFIYVLICIWFVKINYKDTIQFKWLSKLSLAVLITWASYTFTSFAYFISSPIIFSFLFYSFFIFFIYEKKKTTKIFEKVIVKKKLNYLNKDALLLKNLTEIMHQEKLFLNSDVKLSDVSKKINITPHELSKLINKNLSVNFTDYINEFRVVHAKELLKNKSLYTIDAIGNLSGFNSKSAFYKAFKKFTGTTPAKFNA